MRRIAVPVKRGKLNCCFKHCRKFEIIEVKGGNIVTYRTVDAPGFEQKALSEWLADNRVTDVIVNSVKQEFVKICNLNKANVFVGVQKTELNELIQDFINGVLVTNGDMVEY